MSDYDLIKEGFEFGYLHPDEEPGIPLDDEGMSVFRTGMAAGQAARAEYDGSYTGPSIGPEIEGGISWDQYQENARQLLDPLFHKHMPHTEIETYGTDATAGESTTVQPPR